MILGSHWWRVSGCFRGERKGDGLSKQKREGVLVWPAERGKGRARGGRVNLGAVG
jgi:hypothetical protein